VSAKNSWGPARGKLARYSQDLPADHPLLGELRRDIRAGRAEDYIQNLLKTAPPLTDQQRTHLAELLRPVRDGGVS
jgi:hypothetical protein